MEPTNNDLIITRQTQGPSLHQGGTTSQTPREQYIQKLFKLNSDLKSLASDGSGDIKAEVIGGGKGAKSLRFILTKKRLEAKDDSKKLENIDKSLDLLEKISSAAQGTWKFPQKNSDVKIELLGAPPGGVIISRETTDAIEMSRTDDGVTLSRSEPVSDMTISRVQPKIGEMTVENGTYTIKVTHKGREHSISVKTTELSPYAQRRLDKKIGIKDDYELGGGLKSWFKDTAKYGWTVPGMEGLVTNYEDVRNSDAYKKGMENLLKEEVKKLCAVVDELPPEEIKNIELSYKDPEIPLKGTAQDEEKYFNGQFTPSENFNHFEGVKVNNNHITLRREDSTDDDDNKPVNLDNDLRVKEKLEAYNKAHRPPATPKANAADTESEKDTKAGDAAAPPPATNNETSNPKAKK